MLEGLGTPIEFVLQEVGVMGETSYAKTANRSVVGSMTDFVYLAGVQHERSQDLVGLSVRLAGTPCGPLYKSHVTPDRELASVVSDLLRT